MRYLPAGRRILAAAIALAVPVAAVIHLNASAQAEGVEFAQPLRIPPVLTGSNINLTMKEADVQLKADGPATHMWTYNGVFPGPTIRRPTGVPTRVTVRNNLGPEFGDATLHNHGGHSLSTEDGQADSELIPPGGRRTYTYGMREDGKPERSATQWYHDHRMGVTGRNVWNGLAGMFILDDPVDSALPLPKGEYDVPLMITDRTFDENNQIPYEPAAQGPAAVGLLGINVMVNGTYLPYFDVAAHKYRFRLLNASNRRPYIFTLGNGQSFTQIATDGGLLPAPIERTQINLMPGERVEVVVDFAAHLGENITLMNLNTVNDIAPETMQFRVKRPAVDRSYVPAKLRPLPTYPEPSRTRQFVIGAVTDSTGSPTAWTFNGKSFDPARMDADPVLGSTESWTFINPTTQPHAIHLHDVDWLLTERFAVTVAGDGTPVRGDPVAIPAYEQGLKEVFVLPPREGLTVKTTFTDHTGMFMFHCHMLEHEDFGLMGQFDVVKAGHHH